MKATLATLRAPVTLTAGAVEGDKPAGPPTFDAVAYSGGPVPGYTVNPPIKGNYVIDLAGMSEGKNIKANLDHKPTQRVGHVTAFDNNGKQVTVSGALSAATSHRDEVRNSAADGYQWEVSIEANLTKPRKLEAGKTANVNGRIVEGPLAIFSTSKLTALSFVSNGADEGNSVTIAATAAGGKAMSKFDEFVVSCGADPEAISDAQRANLQRLFDGREGAGQGLAGREFSAIVAEERREFERQETIKTVALSATRENPLYTEAIELAVDQAIESKMSARDFELELLRKTRTRAGEFSARMTGRPSDPRVVEAALAMASGLPDIENHYSEQVLDAVDKAGLRIGFSLQQAIMQAAHGNGYTCRAGERVHVGNIREVLAYAFPPITARMSGFSTVSLPNILGAVANKNILAGYSEEDQSWKDFATIKPASNFYQQNHYRLLDSLEYDEIGSGGEIAHGTLGEETYPTQLKSYGKMLGLTRIQILNDDLGAFGDIRVRLGMGAAKKFGNVFWPTYPQLDLSCAA